MSASKGNGEIPKHQEYKASDYELNDDNNYGFSHSIGKSRRQSMASERRQSVAGDRRQSVAGDRKQSMAGDIQEESIDEKSESARPAETANKQSRGGEGSQRAEASRANLNTASQQQEKVQSRQETRGQLDNDKSRQPTQEARRQSRQIDNNEQNENALNSQRATATRRQSTQRGTALSRRLSNLQREVLYEEEFPPATAGKNNDVPPTAINDSRAALVSQQQRTAYDAQRPLAPGSRLPSNRQATVKTTDNYVSQPPTVAPTPVVAQRAPYIEIPPPTVQPVVVVPPQVQQPSEKPVAPLAVARAAPAVPTAAPPTGKPAVEQKKEEKQKPQPPKK